MQEKNDLKLRHQQLLEEKEQLVAAQQKGGKSWTPAMQERLDAVVEEIVDLEEALEPTSEVEEKKDAYVPKPGEERFYHVQMIYGDDKYDSKTGNLIAKPFIQKYTPGEYRHFKEFANRLGYRDIKVLWDPTKK